ncbi:MAG: hypothetical protein ACI4CZ_03700 [Hominisplanchenecus sp.]
MSGIEQGSFRLVKTGDLVKKSFTVSVPADVNYAKEWKYPSVTVKDEESGKVLKEGENYIVSKQLDLSEADDDAVGTIRITVTGKGEYGGEQEVTCRLLKKDISNLLNKGTTRYTYTGKTILPQIAVTYDGMELTAEDYRIDTGDQDLIHVGEKTVTVSGTGNYKGSILVSYQVLPADLAVEAEVEELQKQTYTGYEITPEVVVKHGDQILTEGKDYQLSFRDNRNPGKGVVLISGIGNYKGTLEKSFVIEDDLISVNGLQITTLNEGERREISFGTEKRGSGFPLRQRNPGCTVFRDTKETVPFWMPMLIWNKTACWCGMKRWKVLQETRRDVSVSLRS